jgi:hypothetical protein
MTSIPAALRMLIEGREHDLLEHPDLDLVVAETTEQMLQVLLDTGIGIDELLADPTIIEPLGGFEYVRAVLTWRDDALAWAPNRQTQGAAASAAESADAVKNYREKPMKPRTTHKGLAGSASGLFYLKK